MGGRGWLLAGGAGLLALLLLRRGAAASAGPVAVVGDSYSSNGQLEAALWRPGGLLTAGTFARDGAGLDEMRRVHLPAAVAAGAKVVFLLGGVNDLPGSSAGAIVARVRELVDAGRAAGVVVVPATLPPALAYPTLRGREADWWEANRQLAALGAVNLSSLAGPGGRTWRSGLGAADGLHPTRPGVDAIAALAVPYLLRAGATRRPAD